MMIAGEICNFVAYAFVEAIVVTPLGALSVVICAILSSIFLKETLTFFGWLGCALCIIGSTTIALNGPQEATVGEIEAFQKLFLAPGFLAWGGCLIAASLSIIIYFGPKYGKQSMLWYIFVCSMIGGLSVSCTTGLGASIVTSIQGDNQFKHWFIYFLLIFVSVTLVTEVLYLNKALALFNTAMVTPTYYVIFTFFTLVTSVILFQGLKTSVAQILTIVCGFLTICVGITILQMSKVDPTQLNKLDRKSTILLQAARSGTENAEKSISGLEDPGMDTLRGSFGTVGSIIRARSARRMSRSSRGGMNRASGTTHGSIYGPDGIGSHLPGIGEFQRHQLYDPPVPSFAREESGEAISLKSRPGTATSAILDPNRTAPRTPTIKFDAQDVAHYYPRPGASGGPRHEHIRAAAGDGQHTFRDSGPPLPPLPPPTPGSARYGLAPEDQSTPRPSGKQAQGTPHSKELSLDRSGSPSPQPATAPPSSSHFAQIFQGHRSRDQSPSSNKAVRRGANRHYPKSKDGEDGEESLALVQPGQSKEDSESTEPSDSEITPIEYSGVRLVSSQTMI